MQVINRIVQALLFSLVIIGVFASMAKNAYGFTFMGVSCLGLSFLYLVQLIWKLIEDHSTLVKNDVVSMAELFLLAIMLMLFGFRAFYIYLPSGEIIFMVVCALLIVAYGMIASDIYATIKMENKKLALNMILFFTSLIFFLLSIITRVETFWSLLFGALATLISVPFLISLMRKQQFEIKGEPVTLYQFVKNSKNKAGLLFIFFITSAVYTGLSQYGFIPEIENSDRPKAYIELINNAESGKEKSIEGQFQHEKYKEAMDKFFERHSSKK